jgi:hypothetical protein
LRRSRAAPLEEREQFGNTLASARAALALAADRSTEWPIRRLGPYSCVLGFIVLGVPTSPWHVAGLLIAWQWQRVVATDSVLSMLVQGLRKAIS